MVKAGYQDGDRLDRSKRLSWFDSDALANARVLVVGAGAIGNETAKNLVLAGFKKITLVDMDHIVLSNLNRCLFFSEADAGGKRLKVDVVAEGMRRLDTGVAVETRSKPVQEMPDDFIPGHDLVLGCLDNLAARLYINSRAYAAGIPYVDAGTDGFVGKVMMVIPPEGACLECGANRSHAKIVQQRFGCTGSDVTFFAPKLAAEITTTSVVSAIQVREAMKLVCGKRELAIKNVAYYDGNRNVFEELEVQMNPDCPNHLARRG
ncbi:MAG: ThiF family adenylyltransferase [Methanobacteriota archaeon]